MVRPGLSGIGSIIFRDEEEILTNDNGSTSYYNDVIAPYKGELENWFVESKSLYLYFLLSLITIWVVIFSRSNIIWSIFRSIPKPPSKLQRALKYK